MLVKWGYNGAVNSVEAQLNQGVHNGRINSEMELMKSIIFDVRSCLASKCKIENHVPGKLWRVPCSVFDSQSTLSVWAFVVRSASCS